ncbi:MAG: 6-phosphofructokinase [Acidobacteria bacterium]|nr:6-phosphofructokinase [Acidobacteriota bacterium]
MSQLVGKAVVAQGGGPTAVINQTLAGVALEAAKHPQITRLYGAVHGVRGIVSEDFVDLSQETPANLLRVAGAPSSALLSTRDKPDAEYCQRLFRALKAHDVRFFFYIGGNDSSDTVRIVAEQAAKDGYELRAVHLPKTIDNDLVENDHTPGFPSAARFVAQAFMGANLDNRSLPGVYIAVVMGRHAGFLTAAGAAGRTFEDDGPHLVYLPERPFSKERFLADVDGVMKRLGRCIVAVSEGVADEQHRPIATLLAESVERDAHGNVQLSGSGELGDLLKDLVKKELKISRARADTFGYLQRSYLGVVSDVDQREAREAGERGVQFALSGEASGSVAIRRVGNYAVDFALVPLAAVAAKTRTMPDAFLAPGGNDVTPAFHDYLRPLLGSGFPDVARLRAPRVAKLLGP